LFKRLYLVDVSNFVDPNLQSDLEKSCGFYAGDVCLTMRHLGEMLEVSDSYVSKMETGDKIPDVAMVIKIAGFFEADLNQLLRDELEL
jgi:predicted transcriptional regulator